MMFKEEKLNHVIAVEVECTMYMYMHILCTLCMYMYL